MEATRASTRTLLSWGFADAPIALFKTDGELEVAPEFVKAGPNGRPLERDLALDGRRYAPPAPVEAPEEAEEKDDPLEASRAFQAAVGEPEERPTQAVFEQGGEVPLDDEEVRKGVLDADGKFIDLTDQLAKVEADTKLEKMEVIGFIRRQTVERYRIRGSYYLGSDAAGEETPKALKVLALLRRAILVTERVAVVKWTKRTRQSLGVVVPGPEASLVVLEMVWAGNVLEPGPRSRDLDQVALTPGEEDAAAGLAAAMAESRDVLNDQVDDRVAMESDLVEKALAGKLETFEVKEAPVIAESVDDLERLLELSVEHV